MCPSDVRLECATIFIAIYESYKVQAHFYEASNYKVDYSG